MAKESSEGSAAVGTESGYHGYSGKGTGDAERDQALQRVLEAGREYGLTLLSLNNTAAKSIGVHPTDAWIISYLQGLPAEAAPTPGDLSQITGLTTGAITGVIDRLERDGYVRRERDLDDRRKIIIVTTDAATEISRNFQPMVDGFLELCLRFDADELRTIADYLEGGLAIAEATIERLRT